MLLQGRTDHSGTGVELLSEEGLLIIAVTDTASYFNASVADGTTYKVTATKDLQLVSEAYRVRPGTNLGTTTLLGGDSNNDQIINCDDLYKIADINGDGNIDILDVTLAGANFGEAGPQSW